MGSEAVQSLHEAALSAAHFEDYLFCNELLCTEALDPFAASADLSSPLPPWHGLQHAAASSTLVCNYGDFCCWSSSPPWSSSLTTATTSSITSHSCSPSHDPQIQCLQDDHLDARFPPRSCSKLSLCSAASTDPDVLFVCMHTSSSHGKLESGSCSLIDHRSATASLQASDEEQASDGCESMRVLLERQEWPHCRPLKVYAESMQQCSSPANYMYDVSCEDTSGATYTWPMVRRRAVQCMLEVAKMMRMSLLNVGQAVAYLDRYLSHLIKERCHVSEHKDIHVGVACLWIAFKLEHSHAPDAAVIVQSLVSVMFHNSTEDGITALKSMEANVLGALQWRLLGVSAVEFVDTIISMLRSAPGHISQHPLQALQSRAHEIVQGTLLEVVFARYEACIVGVCAIQHAVEEIWPLQAAPIMHSIHKIVTPKDMREANKCYKDMADLVVDPLNTQLAASSPVSHLHPAAASL